MKLLRFYKYCNSVTMKAICKILVQLKQSAVWNTMFVRNDIFGIEYLTIVLDNTFPHKKLSKNESGSLATVATKNWVAL